MNNNIINLVNDIEKKLLNNETIDIEKIKLNSLFDVKENKEKVKYIFKKKEQKYKNIQLAYKILMNSLYGYFGTKSSRFYNEHIAEAITITGQEESKRVQKCLSDNGFKVLYSDTDSAFILVDNISNNIKNNRNESKKWIKNVFVSKINKIVDTELFNLAKEIGIKNPKYNKNYFFKYKQEMIAESGIFLPGINKDKAKKRYDLYLIDVEGVEKDEILSAGTPAKQTKLPNIVKKYFNEFINKLLKEKCNDKNILISITRKLRDELFDACDSWKLEYLGSFNQFSKKLEEYPKSNSHSHFALVWNKKYADIFKITKYQIKVKYKFIEVSLKPFLNKQNIDANIFSDNEIKYIEELYHWCKSNKVTMIGIVDEENDKFINLIKIIFDIDKERIIEKYVYNIFKPYFNVLNIPIENIAFNISDINELL